MTGTDSLKSSKAKQSALRKGGQLLKGYATAPKPLSTAFRDDNISKASLTRIGVNQLPKAIPDFDGPGTKDGLIAEWLKDWIRTGVENRSLNENTLLPRKNEIADYLGVSIGTVQNAIRFIEDEGFVESKQRIGTVIRDPQRENSRLRKLTSKRDTAVIAVKKLILDRSIQPLEALPSAREIARVIGSAPNTTRLALEYLSGTGVLENRGSRGNKANWFLQTIPQMGENEVVTAIESQTLIDQVERDLKQLIAENFAIGDKLPSHLELAHKLRVSIKTVHDAMVRVVEQGIVQSRRGRYGSFITSLPQTDQLITAEDASRIFMPAQEAVFYNYEKVEKHLKALIAKNFPVGSKLPSMSQLAEQLDVSSNTIRKALQKLADDNIVRFERGRFGGTFVVEAPQSTEDSHFTWVSVNPETVKSYRKATV